jgi:gamma-glutamylcyclotransferase
MTNYTYMWSFGSNLSVRQMAKRCPRAEKVASLHVHDASLIFRAAADIMVEDGGIVPGGLWKLSKQCEAELDRVEGVRVGFYEKRYFNITTKTGRKVSVLYYKMLRAGMMPPAESYLDTIREGYRDFRLDPAILMAAVHRAYAEKKVTQALWDRHERKGRPRLADPTHLLLGEPLLDKRTRRDDGRKIVSLKEYV